MILAVERALRLVRPGGTVAIIVIDGILNNDSKSYVREYIRKHSWVKAIFSLPAVTFEGYHARAKTSILFLVKKSGEEKQEQDASTFMAVIENSGYAPNGAPVAGNELPEVLLAYKAFVRGKESRAFKNSWVATLDERMDAEYYWKKQTQTPPRVRDVAKVAQSAKKRVGEIGGQLAVMRGAMQRAFANLKTEPVSLKELFEPVQNTITINRDKSYRLLGVRWWGGGTFIREEKLGKDIKKTKLNQVSSGWLIYNRLFAFRGSFAVIAAEHDKCYVSSEFPTFRVKDSIPQKQLVAAYITHCLNSPQYLVEVDRDSTGSTKTSRNRYKEHRFLAMKVSFPKTLKQLKALVSLLDKASQLREEHDRAKESLDEMTQGIAKMLPISLVNRTRSGKVEILTKRESPVAAKHSPHKGKSLKVKKRKTK